MWILRIFKNSNNLFLFCLGVHEPPPKKVQTCKAEQMLNKMCPTVFLKFSDIFGPFSFLVYFKNVLCGNNTALVSSWIFFGILFRCFSFLELCYPSVSMSASLLWQRTSMSCLSVYPLLSYYVIPHVSLSFYFIRCPY